MGEPQKPSLSLSTSDLLNLTFFRPPEDEYILLVETLRHVAPYLCVQIARSCVDDCDERGGPRLLYSASPGAQFHETLTAEEFTVSFTIAVRQLNPGGNSISRRRMNGGCSIPRTSASLTALSAAPHASHNYTPPTVVAAPVTMICVPPLSPGQGLLSAIIKRR